MRNLIKSLRKQKQRGHESKKVREILNINSQHETADTDDAYNSSTVQTPQLSNISSFNTENESSHPNTHTKSNNTTLIQNESSYSFQSLINSPIPFLLNQMKLKGSAYVKFNHQSVS